MISFKTVIDLLILYHLSCLVSSARVPSILPSSGMNPMDFLAAVHSSSPLSSSSLDNSSPAGTLGFSMLSEGKSVKEDDEEEEEETEIKLSSGDCRTEREKAERLRTRKRKKENPSSTVYIPECTSDGKYKELQCYQSFCWCVDLESGLPMKVSGSSSSGNSSQPDCSQKKAMRKGKDCPFEQKLTFLKRLTSVFERDLINSKLRSFRRKQQQSMLRSRSRPDSPGRARTPVSPQIKLPDKQQVLSWKFNQIDSNRDESVNQTEWKAFRQSLRVVRKQNSAFRDIRHCFKLFFGGCDTNRDKEVSQDEWFVCMGLDLSFDDGTSVSASQRTQRMSPSYSSSLSRRRRRKRPNPFATILKAD